MALPDGGTTYPYVKHLVDPTETEIDQAVKVLVDAFEGDPFSTIILGGNLELAPQEIRANLQAAFIGGRVHVITIGPRPEDIVGVAIWYPPGSSVFSSEEQCAAGWNQFLESVPDSLRKWWTEYFTPAMVRLSADTFRPGYSFDAWHLHLFGVMKAYHRKGYGKALLCLAESEAKTKHSPIVLETTTEVDVKIYKRLGFQVCGETAIESAQGGVRVWLMFKET